MKLNNDSFSFFYRHKLRLDLLEVCCIAGFVFSSCWDNGSAIVKGLSYLLTASFLSYVYVDVHYFKNLGVLKQISWSMRFEMVATFALMILLAIDFTSWI